MERVHPLTLGTWGRYSTEENEGWNRHSIIPAWHHRGRLPTRTFPPGSPGGGGEILSSSTSNSESSITEATHSHKTSTVLSFVQQGPVHSEWGKRTFTVVHVENKTIIDK